MSLKVAYNGNEEIYTLFNKFELKQLSFDPECCQNIAILLLYLCIDGFKHKNSAVLCPILLNGNALRYHKASCKMYLPKRSWEYNNTVKWEKTNDG